MLSYMLIFVAGVTFAVEPAAEAPQAEAPTVIVVVGAAGEPQFGEEFHQWADRIEKAAEKAQAKLLTVGRGEARRADPQAPAETENADAKSEDKNKSNDAEVSQAAADQATGGAEESEAEATDREKLQTLLAEVDQQSDQPLWIVLIGHGTFDRREAKFNLEGRDVTAAELAEWLGPLERPVAVVGCFSSSAPLINQLAGANRIVATATKSGYELNYSRFGDYFSQAIADPAADLDKDDQVSLLEAFLAASKQVEEFYAGEGRLATEQALLDDNGDGLGTPAAFFRGVRAVKRAKDGAALDGLRAAQLHLIPSEFERSLPAEVRQRRDEIELALARLREQKPDLDEEQYLDQLEPLLVELAELYESLEKRDAAAKTEPAASDDPPAASENAPPASN